MYKVKSTKARAVLLTNGNARRIATHQEIHFASRAENYRQQLIKLVRAVKHDTGAEPSVSVLQRELEISEFILNGSDCLFDIEQVQHK